VLLMLDKFLFKEKQKFCRFFIQKFINIIIFILIIYQVSMLVVGYVILVFAKKNKKEKSLKY
ncbi:hypothetical protein ACEW7V_00030, partial [Areca yellow leaf disease phytoplasma]|uniref:hypothetical protein n=1 Tax=Areca yellow leaf disease phytoplasma TaxID=927614 RepID=UPI0035B5531C